MTASSPPYKNGKLNNKIVREWKAVGGTRLWNRIICRINILIYRHQIELTLQPSGYSCIRWYRARTTRLWIVVLLGLLHSHAWCLVQPIITKRAILPHYAKSNIALRDFQWYSYCACRLLRKDSPGWNHSRQGIILVPSKGSFWDLFDVESDRRKQLFSLWHLCAFVLRFVGWWEWSEETYYSL